MTQPKDILSVACDALHLLEERLAVDETLCPWEDCTAPDEAGISTREGYEAAVSEALDVVLRLIMADKGEAVVALSNGVTL
jgi:cobalamin biosynthesis protein CbiG